MGRRKHINSLAQLILPFSRVGMRDGRHGGQAAVSDYMQQSNRPYSYINVFDNLRKKIPKRE